MKFFLSSLRKLDSSTYVFRDSVISTKWIQPCASWFQASRLIHKSMRKGIPGISLSLCTSLLTIGTSIGIGITFNPQRSWAGTCVGTYSSRSGVPTSTQSQIGYYNSISKSYVPIATYTGGGNINAIATQPSTGNLFFINRATGKTVVYNPNTGTQTTLTGGLSVTGPPTSTSIIGATFNASGNLYVYYGNKTLIEVDPSNGNKTGSTRTISGIPGNVSGGTNGDIAIGTNGVLYALGDTGGGTTGTDYTSRLYSIAISGNTATATAVVNSNITGLGGAAANGLAIDPATGIFYISSSLGTYELNATTNAATLLTSATGTNDLAACGTPTPDLPTITKAFGPDNVVGIPANSTLTLTLGNTNQVPIYLISTLTDNFQTGLTVRSPNGLGGTCLADTANSGKVTATVNSSFISLLDGLKVPAGGCTVTVDVTASTAGTFINTIAAGVLKTTAGNNQGSTTSTLTVLGVDYGDAPITGTAPNGTSTNAYGQATHGVVAGIKLGAVVDSETVSIANATASGDGADDDSIGSFPVLTAGATSYSIPAANITTTGTGTLHAWIDFNKNGTFDVGEYASVAVTNNTLASGLNWTGITAGAVGNTFARFRFTSDTTITSITPSGLAANGEVEDYQMSIISRVKAKANVLIIKRITAIKDGVTGTVTNFGVFEDDITSSTKTNDNNCNWPTATGATGNCINTYTVGKINAGTFKPGDEVEYTTYYLNAGENKANPVRICTRLDSNITFKTQFDNSNATTVGKGIGLVKGNGTIQYLTNVGTDSDKGQLATVTPALTKSCNLDGNNNNNLSNNLVVVDVADTTNPVMGSTGAGTAGSYGYTRFKAVVK